MVPNYALGQFSLYSQIKGVGLVGEILQFKKCSQQEDYR